jgi:predicted AlkP superfamily phosphohydrolase/phosphomutase
MPSSLLVVSIDCVNAELLDELTRSGALPNLSALRSVGGACRTRGLGLSAEGDWLSFYTGMEPAQHGHIAYDEIIPGTYRSQFTTGARTEHKPHYQEIDEAGGRALVLNPVHIGLSKLAHGRVITNFQGHDAGHYFPLASWPPVIAEELADRYPDDPVNPNDWGQSKYADHERLLKGKRETLRRKIAVFRDLTERDPWDYAYLGLDECHEMSHLFWHLHDTAHPRHRATERDPLLAMLRDIDAALGDLFETLPSDCERVVVSLAGIGGNYHWSFLVDELLALFQPSPPARQSHYQLFRRLWNMTPHTLQRSIHELRHNVREAMLAKKRTRQVAFAMPLNEVSGAVRINLAGREPKGIVPAAEFDAVCLDLKSKFESLRCADTGIPLIKSVVRSGDIQSGPHLARMPDLLIEWNTEQPIYRASLPGGGVFERKFDDARTGHHLNDGLILYSSPNEVSSAEPARLSAVGAAITAAVAVGGGFAACLAQTTACDKPVQ